MNIFYKIDNKEFLNNSKKHNLWYLEAFKLISNKKDPQLLFCYITELASYNQLLLHI